MTTQPARALAGLTLALCSLPVAAGQPAGGEDGAPLSLSRLVARDAVTPAAQSKPVASTPPASAAAPTPESAFRSYPMVPGLTHRFELKLGGAIYGRFDTQMQVNSDVGLGANLDLEDLLGLDQSSNLLRVDMSYAFSPRHEVIASYYDIGRSGVRSVNEDINIGNTTIPAGSSLDSELSTTILKLSYLYNFVTDNRTKIGASFGLYNMLIDTQFRTTSNTVQESFKAVAPLPVIGLHGKYALSETWHMLASVELFQIDIGVANGHLLDSILGIEQDLFEHVGWGVAINGFNMDAAVDGDNGLNADLNYGYQGVLIYLRTYF